MRLCALSCPLMASCFKEEAGGGGYAEEGGYEEEGGY